MDALLSIGDFAKMTYLSIKALRHYHDTGLLVPADVDPETGYRRYRADQVPAAQVIRRLRDLGMPLDDVTAVLDAPDLAARNAGISAHLRRMGQQLQQAQATAASLRRLLEEPPPTIAVEYQATAPERVLALRSQAAMDDSGHWWSEAFDELHAVLAAAVGLRRSGPDGALYPAEFFQAGSGEVTAFIPVAGQPHGPGARCRCLTCPARNWPSLCTTGRSPTWSPPTGRSAASSPGGQSAQTARSARTTWSPPTTVRRSPPAGKRQTIGRVRRT